MPPAAEPVAMVSAQAFFWRTLPISETSSRFITNLRPDFTS